MKSVQTGLRSTPTGLLVAVLSVAAATLLVYPLKEVAPAASAGMVYLLPVLAVSIFWDRWIGLFTAILSALAFNLFHIQPTGTLSVNAPENLVALLIFLLVAAITSGLAEVSRARAREADQRRLEADITADFASGLLAGRVSDRLPEVSRHLADNLGLGQARIVLGPTDPDEGLDLPLDLGEKKGRLELPAQTPEPEAEWIAERIVPSIEVIMKVALERDRLQDQAIEGAALQRSDELKTALIRSVSHDFRSPLAAILTSAEAIRGAGLEPSERTELADSIASEASRLSRLVNNLLDLSRLESDAAAPRQDWCSLEEIIETAVDEARRRNPAVPVKTNIEAGVGLSRIDPVQVERALVNLIENAQRFSAPESVTVLLRHGPRGAIIRIVDRGPGIPGEELERIFDPFVTLEQDQAHAGSGLGLAIARGFIEGNGGSVRAESLPGQGATFVVEMPIEEMIRVGD
jgi:two-component system sensor histidine kinase KdpD